MSNEKKHLSEYRQIVFRNPTLSSIGELKVEVESSAPLIPHRWSKKVEKQLLDKHTGTAEGSTKRPLKDPEQDMLECLHVIGPRPRKIEDIAKCRLGIPAVSFKSAIINVAAVFGGIFKSHSRMLIWVDSDADGLVEIKFDPRDVSMRTDPVRNSGRGGTIDVRVRPQISKWSANLTVRYPARKITAEQLVDFLTNAGTFNGLCDWRPAGHKSTGNFGTFEVKEAVARVPNFDKPTDGEAGAAVKKPA